MILCNMIHKLPLLQLLILLIFSFVLSYATVPTTRRSLMLNKEKSSVQTTLLQGDLVLKNGREMFDVEEELNVKERMDLENADYPGTGANNRHDPKSPGRS
ncbi:hypothetical protein Lal_00027828 [Lupinus albus]|uniref:Uncharacterized protein n=1 Tax=Lupinus albus TaxID=3870 RepID=A0A6A4NS62_LUPAL|nr:hypothetical protein Lalb_Chr21g0317311 [Lupinus albus]KAF1859980.1 hypothetical protein Lal_00027828 [Lupinus albus]